MNENRWPQNFHDLLFVPRVDECITALADLAEPEDWSYQHVEDEHSNPVLYNYIKFTYKRLAEENKIEISDDGQLLVFNTGLVTPAQEAIYCTANPNKLDGIDAPWHIKEWRRRGEHSLTSVATLPEMASYYDDPSALVLDHRKEVRVNVEHVIADNKDRFPEPYGTMDNYALQTFLKGAVDNALERARRNYKTAIPQYYRGNIQLMIPLCLSRPDKADLALVLEKYGDFYRASTCLTLEMAYNNARQLARPDRDWLQP